MNLTQRRLYRARVLAMFRPIRRSFSMLPSFMLPSFVLLSFMLLSFMLLSFMLLSD